MTTLTAVMLHDVMRLIYTNEVETKTANAMVLPVYGEFKGFVKLDKEYDQLALHLYQGYQTIKHSGKRGARQKKARTAEILQYGSYLVSFAKSLDEVDWAGFAEKGDDTMMRLMHTRYPPAQGYGFVVAKINPDATSNKTKHPIVFDVARQGVYEKFLLPTYHLHHGKEEEPEADWDHLITTVNCRATQTTVPDESNTIDLAGVKWEEHLPMLNKLLNEWKVGDVGCMQMTRIRGTAENVDVWVEPPAIDDRNCDLCHEAVTSWPYYSCSSCADLDFCGKCFSHEAAGKFQDAEKKHRPDHAYHKMAKAGDRKAFLDSKKTCSWCAKSVPEKTPYSSCTTCPLVTQCAACSSTAPTTTPAGHLPTHTMIAVTSFNSAAS